MNPESASPRIRVLLVDDSELVRTGLSTLLAVEPTLSVVGTAATVADGVAAGLRLKPDVVLLDIRLPDGTGIDACRQILRSSPDTRVLMVTSVVDDAVIDDAIRAGAHGYLLKEIDGRGLVNAIRDVAAGRSILDPAVTARVIQLVKSAGPGRDPLAGLTPTERQILGLIATGHTNREVGATLGIGEKTVRNHISTIFEKLHVTRRAEAAAIYARESRPQ
ncbi:MAG: response regulator transcription factor [Opitutaceae bacterium]|nr:response regulator transcription factor [Opitutaceae bacterium]